MSSLSELFENNSSNVNKTTTTNPCAAITSLVFKAQTDAHLTHLLQKDKTLARHVAMEKFYEEIDGVLDDFIEMYMGLYPIAKLTVPSSANIDDPLTYFEALYKDIDKARKPIKESFLQNEIDSVQAIVVHTLYRLKNITD